MNSPHALILSLAATVCGFALVLVLIASQASHAATPVVEVALAPTTVSIVAQEVTLVDSIAWTVALDPAARR